MTIFVYYYILRYEMGKLIRVVSLAITIILVLIIVLAIILPLALDPNDFKPEIEAAVYQYTGKKLVLDGDLELSLFPWLGISMGKATVLNPSSDEQQTLATIDEGHIKVKLLPLLLKQVELNRIVIINPVIHLLKDEKGNKNWQNSAPKSDPEISTTDNSKSTSQAKSSEAKDSNADINASDKPPFLEGLVIAGVNFENGTIIWIDRKKEQEIHIQQLNLDVETLTFDQPAKIDLSMQIKRDNRTPEHLTAKTQLVFNQDFNNFNLTNLNIKVLANTPEPEQKVVTVARSTHIDLDWQKQTLNISALKVSSGGMLLTANLSGSEIKDQPEFKGSIAVAEFNPREFFQNLEKPLPDLKDPSSLSRLSGSMAFSANKNSAQLSNIKAKVDNSTMTGHCVISDFKQPAYEFNFNLDTINLDRYLISKDNLDQDKKNTLKKNTQLSKVLAAKQSPSVKSAPSTSKVTHSEQKSKVKKTIFPIEQLRKLRATGQVSISKMITNGLTLQDFVIKLDAQDGVLNTTHNIDKFYQGRYSGSLSLDVKQQNPSIALNEKFTNIQAEPLLKDLNGKARFTGTLTGNTRLSSRGNTVKSIKARLKGNAQVSLKKGVIYGFNLREMVKKSRALIKNKDYSPEKNHTDYSKITADAIIKNGVLKSNHFYAEAESLKVKGNGSANLNNEQLDYHVIADLMKRKQATNEPDEIKRSLGINIAGKFEQPTFDLDIKSLVTEKEKQKLYDKAEKKLGKGVSDILKQFLQ